MQFNFYKTFISQVVLNSLFRRQQKPWIETRPSLHFVRVGRTTGGEMQVLFAPNQNSSLILPCVISRVEKCSQRLLCGKVPLCKTEFFP